MIKSINDYPRSGKIDIDLTGPMGNAYYLLGLVNKLNNELDLELDTKSITEDMMSGDYEHLLSVFDELDLELDTKSITEDMMSGDYEHLLSVFDEHFGNFVNLYR